MHQPKRTQQTTTGNVKLPKLPGLPGLDDTHFLMLEAQKSRPRIVEMPWSSQDKTQSFVLTARFPIDGNEPLWTFYRGEILSGQMVWTYPSTDAALIANLVLSETTGGLQESLDSKSFASAPQSEHGAPAPQAPPAQHPEHRSHAQARGKASLEGNLSNMQAPSLLQSMNISHLSGRLTVQSANGIANIFFSGGNPVHAIAGDTRGDLAIIEFITWEEGDFHFYSDEQTQEKTINKRLDTLLMEGIAVLDQLQYLKTLGFTQDSYILRPVTPVTEAEFEALVSKCAPVDMVAQKQFYQSIDNRSTMFELLRRRPMSKPAWAAIMYNLLSCRLVGFDKAPPHTVPQTQLQATGIDRAAIRATIENLLRPETGIFTFPSWLYFLEQEFERYVSFGWPFSIIVFEVKVKPVKAGGSLEPLPIPAAAELAARINSVKRSLDLLGHYETFNFALVLPNTNSAGAALLANRLVEVIYRAPLMPQLVPQSLALAIGVSSVPDDFNELEMLLSAANEAKNRARSSGSPIVLYRDLKGSS